MSLEIKVPTVGESINEVSVAQWVKNDGDHVEMDEVICELESDKATFEVTAETAGKLQHKVAEGDTLGIGDLLAVIEPSGDAPAAIAEPAPVAAPTLVKSPVSSLENNAFGIIHSPKSFAT